MSLTILVWDTQYLRFSIHVSYCMLPQQNMYILLERLCQDLFKENKLNTGLSIRLFAMGRQLMCTEKNCQFFAFFLDQYCIVKYEANEI